MHGYPDRGLAPRSITAVFEGAAREARTTGRQFAVRVSYLQVYNEAADDLLPASACITAQLPGPRPLKDPAAAAASKVRARSRAASPGLRAARVDR